MENGVKEVAVIQLATRVDDAVTKPSSRPRSS